MACAVQTYKNCLFYPLLQTCFHEPTDQALPKLRVSRGPPAISSSLCLQDLV